MLVDALRTLESKRGRWPPTRSSVAVVVSGMGNGEGMRRGSRSVSVK